MPFFAGVPASRSRASKAREALVEQFFPDAETLGELLGKFPGAASRRPFAAVHVERQADDDNTEVTIAQHRSDGVEVAPQRSGCSSETKASPVGQNRRSAPLATLL